MRVQKGGRSALPPLKTRPAAETGERSRWSSASAIGFIGGMGRRGGVDEGRAGNAAWHCVWIRSLWALRGADDGPLFAYLGASSYL